MRKIEGTVLRLGQDREAREREREREREKMYIDLPSDRS